MHKTPQKAHVVGIGKPINLDIILISLANSALFSEHVLVLLADLFWPISLSYAEAIYHRSLAPRRKQPERTTGLAAPPAAFFSSFNWICFGGSSISGKPKSWDYPRVTYGTYRSNGIFTALTIALTFSKAPSPTLFNMKSDYFCTPGYFQLGKLNEKQQWLFNSCHLLQNRPQAVNNSLWRRLIITPYSTTKTILKISLWAIAGVGTIWGEVNWDMVIKPGNSSFRPHGPKISRRRGPRKNLDRESNHIGK